jgi:hypothetical protein
VSPEANPEEAFIRAAIAVTEAAVASSTVMGNAAAERQV